ncbi:MAG: methionyl-tRNA formyltransferase [Holophagaceae bacterium]|nr:methionyl-tRNA formyltransferase [Holophagaceae bacterium]
MFQPRVAFFGTPSIAVPPLIALAKHCHIHAVFCNPDRPQRRGHILEPPPTKATAIKLGLEVHQPESWKDESTKLLWDSLKIDLAIVVAYGHILPPWMLDSCSLGAWNLHFSLLPKWRGAAPVNYAILSGDEETGVSLMKITPGLDSGPILAQCSRPITMKSSADELLAELTESATNLLVAHLEKIFSGDTNTWKQDENLVTIAPKLNKEMAKLNKGKDAMELHRQIRALQPWPGAGFRLKDTTIKILEAGSISPTDNSSGIIGWDKNGVWLSANDNKQLELLKLQRPGKQPQPAKQVMQYWGASGMMEID